MVHKPSSAWPLRRETMNTYVRTTEDDGISIVGPAGTHSGDLGELVLSRKDARLLAKRIVQCLEGSAR